MTSALEKIGKSRNVSLSQIALAYVMAKQPYIFPIIGVRKIEQLQDNINALSIRLTKEEMEEIEKAYDFRLGFPHEFIGQHPSQNWLLKLVGHCDWVESPKSLNAS